MLQLMGLKLLNIEKKTDYWKKRIEGRDYDYIHFRNGYAKVAPTMLVKYNGYEVGFNGIGEEYRIKIGKIIEVNNYE